MLIYLKVEFEFLVLEIVFFENARFLTCAANNNATRF
jgi:hypothetical protein